MLLLRLPQRGKIFSSISRHTFCMLLDGRVLCAAQSVMAQLRIERKKTGVQKSAEKALLVRVIAAVEHYI